MQTLLHDWLITPSVMSHANNPCYCCPVTESWLTLCDPMNYSTLVHLVLHSLPEFAQTHVHWVDNAIQPSHRLSSPPSPPALNLSRELALHIRWSKYWGFSIHPSNEYSGLISFRMDWFDLRAVQEALKSLLQHHNQKRGTWQEYSSENTAVIILLLHSKPPASFSRLFPKFLVCHSQL